MTKKFFISRRIKEKLTGEVRRKRRETIYKMLKNRNAGKVPCFVCDHHVEEKDATLEHILPLCRGGTDDMVNLAISHERCNKIKGSELLTSINENAMMH